MMSLMQTLINKPSIEPPKIIVYGEPGVGKTTLAAQAAALLIDCENGAGTIPNLNRTPYLKTWPQMKSWLMEIANNPPQGCQCIAIDTLDWMITRIVEYVVMDLDGDKGITNTLGKSHGGYMKGRDVALNIVYRELLPMLNAISAGGMALIILAHAKNEKGTTPEGFERRTAAPDIPEWIRAPFIEWADAVLYAKPDHTITTQCTNQILAKNRYQFPAEMPLSWAAIMAALTPPTLENANGNITV